MLFDLPDHQTLYAALLARDAHFDGQAFVCVSSTGVFCRLTCPARKPKAENCTFFATVGECIEAGYRACKRCHPLQAAALADPTIAGLLHALDERPDLRWSEGHVEQLGYDLSTVRRSFKRQFGMTFLEMARQRRLREGFETLATGGKVITAQHEASFESSSAFRAAFARLLGCAPADLRADRLLRATWIPTPLGDMIAVSSRSHLHLLEFVDRKGLPAELARLQAASKEGIGIGFLPPSEQAAAELAGYFAARSDRFLTPLALVGSAFTQQVWDALRDIPAGETRSYSDIARHIGRPSAVRAVARANGANQIALMIPCHRVIGADGSLTGYGGGLWRKQRLIEIERQLRRSKKETLHDVTHQQGRDVRSLHVPHDPIILYNIWDAGSAKAVVRAGAKAIATGSWSVAAAQGYDDGEELPLDDALAVVGRILQSVECPVTVDFEGGYATDPDTLGQNVRRLLALGVIGLNFEDQVVNAPGLYSIEDQVERLRAVRAAADALGVPAFINARTDLFLNAAPNVDHASLVDDALARAAAYAEAGADGFFVPGLMDKTLIHTICKTVALPVNVMVVDPQDHGDLASLGVSRISFGPRPLYPTGRRLGARGDCLSLKLIPAQRREDWPCERRLLTRSRHSKRAERMTSMGWKHELHQSSYVRFWRFADEASALKMVRTYYHLQTGLSLENLEKGRSPWSDRPIAGRRFTARLPR